MKPLTLFRDAVRGKEIVTVLVRYGFSNLLSKLNIPTGWIDRLVTKSDAPLTPWKRIRLAMEDLGPTFVKIGQIISTRPDMIPQPLLEELKDLRDKVRPEPFDAIEKVLNVELPGNWQDHFEFIDPDPVGSGSIAQVHLAVLKSTGEKVAIKVQRPGIERAITSDLEIINWLAKEIHERDEDLRPYNLPQVVKHLKKNLLLELDFKNEANNAKLFNARNPFAETIFAPRIYDEFTTQLIVVTEFVDGVSIANVDLPEETKKELAQSGGESIFHQIITLGYFHADPHPGNLLVTTDNRLCLLDWGMAGQLTRQMRYHLADLLTSVIKHDVEKIARTALRMSENSRSVNSQQLEMQITVTLDSYGSSISIDDIGSVMLDLLHVFGDNKIEISQNYVLLAKAVISMEQTGKSLDPNFNIGEIAEPFIRNLQTERWQPTSLLKKLFWAIDDGIYKFFEFPGNFSRILKRIEQEDISLNLHHKGLNGLTESVNRSANRLVLAIIIGSLIMGSSMVITTGVKPLLWGFPALGLVGYLFSFLFGVWVMIDILRSGGHK